MNPSADFNMNPSLKALQATGRYVADSFNSQVQDTELGAPYKVWGNACFDELQQQDEAQLQEPQQEPCCSPRIGSCYLEGDADNDDAVSMLSSVGELEFYSSRASGESPVHQAEPLPQRSSQSLCSSSAKLSQADSIEAWEAELRGSSRSGSGASASTSVPAEALWRPAPPAAGLVRCYVRRTKSRLPGGNCTFTMHLQSSDALLLAARKKQGLAKSTTYVIAADVEGLKHGSCVAKLKANVMGTEFVLSAPEEGSSGKHVEQLCISYRPSGMDTLSGPRSMTVALPEDAAAWRQAAGSSGTLPEASSSLAGALDAAKRRQLPAALERKLSLLCSRPPERDEASGRFTLNFPGRAVRQSTKNLQLASWDHNKGLVGSELALQVAKLGDNLYAVDFAYPMHAASAFAVALASFDEKMCYMLG